MQDDPDELDVEQVLFKFGLSNYYYYYLLLSIQKIYRQEISVIEDQTAIAIATPIVQPQNR